LEIVSESYACILLDMTTLHFAGILNLGSVITNRYRVIIHRLIAYPYIWKGSEIVWPRKTFIWYVVIVMFYT